MKSRQAILFALLFATLAASWWVDREEAADAAPEVVAAVLRPADSRLAPTPPAEVAEASPVRFPGGGADLFPAESWRPQPPPVVRVEPPPPPPPMAPPLPFKYLGRWSDELGETVFLAQGDSLVTARAGQRLAAWRLDKVGAHSLEFTYEPLNQSRQLRLTP